MKTIVTALLVISLCATLGTFFAGMLGFSAEKSDPQRSNRLMRLRVLFQAISLLLFMWLMALG
ncbi:twin transmembrane helix small protein [Acetobacteraceae bacterium H6797]|nr:twin transmembrane helix small protein [Acetobacteraceae bacterium H6797]